MLEKFKLKDQNQVGIMFDIHKFGFNTQEKVDEVSGDGNHNTALFWEYDTRLGRRWNLDTKPQVGISDYAVMGCNPVFNMDWLGDIWGKQGKDPKNNDDYNDAQKIKKEAGDKKTEYQNTYNDAMKKLNDPLTPTADKQGLIEKAQEANVGIAQMDDLVKKIDAMDADKDNYYVFKATNLNSINKANMPTSEKNDDGTNTVFIQYAFGSDGNQVHETIHAGEIALGNATAKYGTKWWESKKKTNKYILNNITSEQAERSAYLGQYFLYPSSMPVKVSSYKDIMHIGDYLSKVSSKFRSFNIYQK